MIWVSSSLQQESPTRKSVRHKIVAVNLVFVRHGVMLWSSQTAQRLHSCAHHVYHVFVFFAGADPTADISQCNRYYAQRERSAVSQEYGGVDEIDPVFWSCSEQVVVRSP